MKKLTSLLVLALVFVTLTMSVSASQIILEPIADAYVRDGDYAEDNFGDSDQLEVKWEAERDGMTRTSFLTFDISDIESAQNARLRLYVEFSDKLDYKILAFYDVTGQEWAESDLTWENAPLSDGEHIRDTYLDDFADTWLDLDLTEIVNAYLDIGSDTISVRIDHKSDHWGGLVRFASREAEENRPQLVITK